MERDGYMCQKCLKGLADYVYLEVHHIIPRRKGGLDTSDNLITLCRSCHNLVEPYPEVRAEEISATLDSIRALPKEEAHKDLWTILLKIDPNLRNAFKDLCFDERKPMAQKIVELIDKELQQNITKVGR